MRETFETLMIDLGKIQAAVFGLTKEFGDDFVAAEIVREADNDTTLRFRRDDQIVDITIPNGGIDMSEYLHQVAQDLTQRDRKRAANRNTITMVAPERLQRYGRYKSDRFRIIRDVAPEDMFGLADLDCARAKPYVVLNTFMIPGTMERESTTIQCFSCGEYLECPAALDDWTWVNSEQAKKFMADHKKHADPMPEPEPREVPGPAESLPPEQGFALLR